MTAIFWLVVVAVFVPMGAAIAIAGDRQDKRIFHTSGFRDAPRHRARPHRTSISCRLPLQLVIWPAKMQSNRSGENKKEMFVKLEPESHMQTGNVAQC